MFGKCEGTVKSKLSKKGDSPLGKMHVECCWVKVERDFWKIFIFSVKISFKFL